jgi:hypothetical protein
MKYAPKAMSELRTDQGATKTQVGNDWKIVAGVAPVTTTLDRLRSQTSRQVSYDRTRDSLALKFKRCSLVRGYVSQWNSKIPISVSMQGLYYHDSTLVVLNASVMPPIIAGSKFYHENVCVKASKSIRLTLIYA